MIVKIFVLKGVVKSFSSLPCFHVSGVIDFGSDNSLWKATPMPFSVDIALLTCKLCNLVIV